MSRYVPYLEVSFTGRLNNNLCLYVCVYTGNYVRVVIIIFGKIVLAYLRMLAAS